MVWTCLGLIATAAFVGVILHGWGSWRQSDEMDPNRAFYPSKVADNVDVSIVPTSASGTCQQCEKTFGLAPDDPTTCPRCLSEMEVCYMGSR